MSSLAVRRYYNTELNDCINEIEKKNNVKVKACVVGGYRELEVQRGKCQARSFAVVSLAASALLIYSSVILAYGSGKAYSEFENEGGLSNGGSSVGGHSAEWWPKALESAATVGLSFYVLYYKGKFHNMARLCKEKISQISQDTPEKKELIEGLVDYSREKTEELRLKFPIVGDSELTILPLQNEEGAADVGVVIDSALEDN